MLGGLLAGIIGAVIATLGGHAFDLRPAAAFKKDLPTVKRTSGFHVGRPVPKLADGSFVVGDSADGVQSSNSQLFLESELAIANVRWLPLDISAWSPGARSGCSPTWPKWTKRGFADLHPGSGHGWGGFVNVARIEVYGTPVKR